MDSMLDSKPTTSYKPKRKSYQIIFPLKAIHVKLLGIFLIYRVQT